MSIRRYQSSLPHAIAAAGLIFAASLVLAYESINYVSLVWVYVFFSGSGLAALIFWLRVPWPNLKSRYLSFGGVILLGFVLQHSLIVLDWYLQGGLLWRWPVTTIEPGVALLKGEVISFVGTMLMVISWLISGGLRNTVFSSVRSVPEGSPYLLIWIYLTGLTTAVFLRFEASIEALRMLGVYATLFASGATYLLAVQQRWPRTRLATAFFMTLPLLMLSLSGMKEGMIIAALPLLLVAWATARTLVSRAIFVAFALIILLFATTFSNFVRQSYWTTGVEFSAPSALSGYLDYLAGVNTGDTSTEPLPQLTSRVNSSVYQPWGVIIADQRGFQPEMIFAPIVTVFIPRVIWPEKPNYTTGQEFTTLLFGENHGMGSTSIGTGTFPAFYLGYGWTAVILGSVLLGAIVAITERLALLKGGETFALIFAYGLIPYALKMPETWPAGAITYPVITFVYLSIIAMAVKLFAQPPQKTQQSDLNRRHAVIRRQRF